MSAHLANVLCPNGPVKPKHAIGLFVLLQIYFATNLLSFGFWKGADGVLGYMLVYFGTWIAVLVLLLSLILVVARRFNRSWLTLAVLVILSIPFSWELWVRSIQIDRHVIRISVYILLLPAMYLYFRIGLERARWTASAVLLLCVLSFAGHAGFSVSTGSSRDFDMIEMDKRTNVHVIMLDSLTHSSFSKEFMGVENSAADYLASLDDTIYAGSLGFSEHVPTKASWGALFNLGRKSRDRGFFSGATPSRLTVLLRKSGYSITTGFSSDYFGWLKGDYVDHYYRGKMVNLTRSLTCVAGYGLLGFCSRYPQLIFSRFFTDEFEDEFERKNRTKEWPDTVVDLIDRAERKRNWSPVFGLPHLSAHRAHHKALSQRRCGNGCGIQAIFRQRSATCT